MRLNILVDFKFSFVFSCHLIYFYMYFNIRYIFDST